MISNSKNDMYRFILINLRSYKSNFINIFRLK